MRTPGWLGLASSASRDAHGGHRESFWEAFLATTAPERVSEGGAARWYTRHCAKWPASPTIAGLSRPATHAVCVPGNIQLG
jgi:hypothetical protein